MSRSYALGTRFSRKAVSADCVPKSRFPNDIPYWADRMNRAPKSCRVNAVTYETSWHLGWPLTERISVIDFRRRVAEVFARPIAPPIGYIYTYTSPRLAKVCKGFAGKTRSCATALEPRTNVRLVICLGCAPSERARMSPNESSAGFEGSKSSTAGFPSSHSDFFRSIFVVTDCISGISTPRCVALSTPRLSRQVQISRDLLTDPAKPVRQL